MSKKPTYEELEERIAALEDLLTDRAEVERALVQSERRHRDLYDNAPDLFVSVDAETAIVVDCNKMTLEALGYARAELLGRPVFDLYDAESAERAREVVFPLFAKTGSVRDQELRLKRKDGSVFDVSLNVSAVRDESGDILYSRSIWRDITARKQVETALQRQAHALNERSKELDCLYNVIALVGDEDASLDGIIQGIVDLIPPSWQYPQTTCARIVVGEREYRTDNFSTTPWTQKAELNLHDEARGVVEVCYLDRKQEENEGPFLCEERQLLNAIADRVSCVIERTRLKREHQELQERLEATA